MASHPGLLGRIAVHYKLISMEQLVEATREQSRCEHKKLGEILVERNLITPVQLTELLEVQRQYVENQRRKAAEQAQAAGRATPVRPIQTPRVTTAEPRAAPAREAEPAGLEIERTAHEAAPAVTPQSLEIEPTAYQGRPTATPQEAPGSLELDPVEEPPAATPPPPDVADAAPPPPVVAAVSAPAKSYPAPDPRAAAWLRETLTSAAKMRASDVLIHAGSKLKLRIFGRLVDRSDGEISRENAALVLEAALSATQRARLDEDGEVDFALALPGVGRFRANIYRQHRGLSGAFHFLPLTLPSLSDLGLPSSLVKLTNFHQGMVLVTGPAGCGKTSTLAALINILNEERADHILTIEDPIEYIHTSKRCVVNQRQVVSHTESFPRALRAALREDPDIICIGELRDLETISLALSAAETGHLVLATLHTSSAIRTLNRIVGAYPPGQQAQVRSMLSESLHAIVSQRLVPTADNQGVALALEILHITKAVANMLREDRAFQIQSVLQTGRAHGMLMLDHSLQDLVASGRITKAVAAASADDPKLFA